MKLINEATKIALRDLRCCYDKWGVFASLINFSDYWARDSFWAIFGMLEVEDIGQARKTLKLFMKYQHKSGMITRKISNDFNRLKYILRISVRRIVPKPVYKSPMRSSFAMDGNLLFVIGFCRYFTKTGDEKFARKNFLKVRSALDFYQSKKMLKGALLAEYGLSSWMDTVFKSGYVLYTNSLWYEAARQFEILADSLGYARSAHVPPSKVIKQSIQDTFWLPTKEYFADSVSKNNKPAECFDLAGNVLSIVYDIANPEQSSMIFLKIRSIENKNSGLHPVNDPVFPWWKINPFATIAGIYRYHNGVSWPWVEALLAVAYVKRGHYENAYKTLTDLSRIIVKNGHVHESYHLDGAKFGNFFWKSAVPFAWSSGLFLYAVKKFEEQTSKDVH